MKNSKKIITVTHGCWTYGAIHVQTDESEVLENVSCHNQGKPYEMNSDELEDVIDILWGAAKGFPYKGMKAEITEMP